MMIYLSCWIFKLCFLIFVYLKKKEVFKAFLIRASWYRDRVNQKGKAISYK